MKMVQVRFGMGRNLDEYGSPDEPWSSDRSVTESEAKELVRVYGSAKVIDEREVDIVLADKFDPDAPPFYWDAFERAVILRVARPKEPARGYPKTSVTVLINGNPYDVSFKIVPALDPYDWPTWGIDSSLRFQVVKAAVAMYDGLGGGIGDLKRAAKGLIKLRGLQAGQRTGRHLTAQELAIIRLAFPSLHGILGEEHLKEALDALESQGRDWAEELKL